MKTASTMRPSRTLSALARDTRGAAALEYISVFALVGIVAALALWRLAPGVVRAYSQQRQALYQETP